MKACLHDFMSKFNDMNVMFFCGFINREWISSIILSLAFSGTAQSVEIIRIGYESGEISPQIGIVAENPLAMDAIQIDCTVARAGKCSLKTTLRRADSYLSYGRYRAETETMKFAELRYSEGESIQYGFSFRVSPQWQYDNRTAIDCIWQFKRFDSYADMFVALKGHDVVLRVLSHDQYVLKKNFLAGIWMDIKIRVFWSTGKNGLVNVYFREDGEESFRLVESVHGPNMFNSIPKYARPKWGLYKPGFASSDFDGPRTVFHDEIYVDREFNEQTQH